MKFARTYSAPNEPYAGVTFEPRTSKIVNPNGSMIFEAKDIQIPAQWSQVATDIIAQKYFRKAGVPSALKGVEEAGIPQWLWRSEPADDATFGPETDARQVFHRLAGTWTYWGYKYGYFDSEADARAYYDEMCAMLARQIGAPNSPQWFNTGLHWAYGIAGPAQGHHFVDPKTGELTVATSAYEHPAPHACFIQSVSDDLVNEGGIMDLWVREARIFKYGSGTGSNFSMLRGEGEKLSGGGTSSGLMSFLRVGDRAAGAIKSGGTTRRAAKMVCLDMDHPEIVDFINWKQKEEKKAHALIAAGFSSDFNGEAYRTIAGQNSNNSIRLSDDFMKAVEAGGKWQTIMRTTGEVCDTYDAKDMWRQASAAAWACADPGVQYDTTINKWHTCPNSGKINASNPCSEYMFLDDTACNLASINLTKFLREDGDGAQSFDVDGFRHACKIFFMAQEILVDLSSYPT
jgi:ribonucleoside-diphosphate reductase alpha chain